MTKTMVKRILWAQAGFCLALGLAAAPLALPIAEAANQPPEADRAAILAMLGDYEVAFQFDEHLTLDPEAEASESHRSKALEIVRLVEDRGDFISLQHILVTGEGDTQRVVKHWRQDWQFEDDVVYEYQGHDTWKPRELTESERAGAWSQAVYQVDDSPRYQAVGRWTHYDGYSYWDSNAAWRPLPRREHTKRGDYDVLVSRNRQAITPDGWTHEQDNYKLALRRSGDRVLARETGFNTYTRVEGADVAVAEEYWEETGDFWAQVRAHWNQVMAEGMTITIPESNDSPMWRELFRLARDAESSEAAERIAEVMDEHAEFQAAK